jgi:hypothetical protein
VFSRLEKARPKAALKKSGKMEISQILNGTKVKGKGKEVSTLN